MRNKELDWDAERLGYQQEVAQLKAELEKAKKVGANLIKDSNQLESELEKAKALYKSADEAYYEAIWENEELRAEIRSWDEAPARNEEQRTDDEPMDYLFESEHGCTKEEYENR